MMVLLDSFLNFAGALRDFDFLQRALWINLLTGLVTAPLGVLLVLRRMSLMGDALSHALLPGVAVSYFFFGFSVPAMIVGGFLAGSTVVFLTVWAQRHSPLKEDSNFAAFYLLSLAAGVLAISARGNSSDLMHILFGSSLTATSESLKITFFVCSVVALLFLLFHRYFVLEIFDPNYLLSRGFNPLRYQTFFLLLVVGCLIVSFQTNGTLLAMGQLLFPGIIARLWSQRITPLIFISMGLSCWGAIGGLWLSFQMDWPLGPSTLLLWGLGYLVSLLFNPYQGFLKILYPRKHFEK